MASYQLHYARKTHLYLKIVIRGENIGPVLVSVVAGREMAPRNSIPIVCCDYDREWPAISSITQEKH